MDDVTKVIPTTLEDILRVLSAGEEVGEPMTFDGNTVIHLMAIGFGFSAGGGRWRRRQRHQADCCHNHSWRERKARDNQGWRIGVHCGSYGRHGLENDGAAQCGLEAG